MGPGQKPSGAPGGKAPGSSCMGFTKCFNQFPAKEIRVHSTTRKKVYKCEMIQQLKESFKTKYQLSSKNSFKIYHINIIVL